MKRSRLLLLIAAAVVFALPALQGDAKPLYCNYACYPPWNGTSSTPCTCPQGTLEFGLITTCGGYWAGICQGVAASTAADAAASLAELEAAIFDGAPVPVEETAPAAAE